MQRRLYRSGESIYLIDGKPCRLRDIQEIFLGTGLGPNSYAIIEQGRVGQLLSSKPSDRRSLIEEAAGITKFKAKRKLAESRLEAARQNLSRVNDILAEVDRQRNSLKRQASKARRYIEVRNRMREVLSAVYSTRAEMMVDRQEKVEISLALMGGEGKRLEQAIDRLNALVHQRRTDVASEEHSLETMLYSIAVSWLKGFVREVLLLATIILAILFSAWFYRSVGGIFKDVVRTENLALFFGFSVIFVVTLLAGLTAILLLTKFMKFAKLQWADRLLGAAFGFIRGWLIGAVILLALTAFEVQTERVKNSELAPYFLPGARAIAVMTPYEIKAKFLVGYRAIERWWRQQ